MEVFLSTPLTIARENTRFGLEEALDSIAQRDADEATGSAYLRATAFYRRLAQCELLLEADPQRFFALLYKSGQVRRHFLHAVNGGRDAASLYVCASRSTSFMDALSSGAFALAAELAGLSPERPLTEVEYEEDFLRHHFFHRLCLKLHDGRSVDLDGILEAWTSLLAEEDYYVDVCRSLIDQDSAAFHDALSALVADRLRKVEESRNDFAVDPEVPLVSGPIFVDGLAIIRLAERQEMIVDGEHDTIPGFVRGPGLTAPLPEEAWRRIDADLP